MGVFFQTLKEYLSCLIFLLALSRKGREDTITSETNVNGTCSEDCFHVLYFVYRSGDTLRTKESVPGIEVGLGFVNN